MPSSFESVPPSLLRPNLLICLLLSLSFVDLLPYQSTFEYCKQFVETGIRVSTPVGGLSTWLTIGSANTMKRDSSDIEPSSPISSQSQDFRPDITPPPTSKSKNIKAKVPSTPSPKKRAKSSSGGSCSGTGGNGEWTPEKKAIFVERVLAAGYKVVDLGELTAEVSGHWSVLGVADEMKQLGMSRQQLHNQMAQGRKGNLREKAVQGAKGV
jgi:hypothetical protein